MNAWQMDEACSKCGFSHATRNTLHLFRSDVKRCNEWAEAIRLCDSRARANGMFDEDLGLYSFHSDRADPSGCKPMNRNLSQDMVKVAKSAASELLELQTSHTGRRRSERAQGSRSVEDETEEAVTEAFIRANAVITVALCDTAAEMAAAKAATSRAHFEIFRDQADRVGLCKCVARVEAAAAKDALDARTAQASVQQVAQFRALVDSPPPSFDGDRFEHTRTAQIYAGAAALAITRAQQLAAKSASTRLVVEIADAAAAVAERTAYARYLADPGPASASAMAALDVAHFVKLAAAHADAVVEDYSRAASSRPVPDLPPKPPLRLFAFLRSRREYQMEALLFVDPDKDRVLEVVPDQSGDVDDDDDDDGDTYASFAHVDLTLG